MDHGSLAFIHIKIFLQCGQCQAGESKTEDATLMVFLVKKPLIPVFFFSSSEVNSYQCPPPCPMPSTLPCSISVPQSKHFMSGVPFTFYSSAFSLRRECTRSTGKLSSMSITSNKCEGNSVQPIRLRYSPTARRSTAIFPCPAQWRLLSRFYRPEIQYASPLSISL